MKRFFARLRGRVSQAYNTFFPATLKKKTWWPVFLIGVLLIAIVAVVPAHAALVEDILNFAARTLASLLIELAKLCIFLTIFFLRAFITFASYNNFIDVSVVKLGWVMVRDVANMFFIVGLLVIAFATILGFESYEWKHGLVHIVLMAILINFSNLIAQLIIDVAHIFTITFLNAVSATAGGNLITLFQMDKVLALASGSPDALGQTKDVASLTLFAGAVLAFIFALLAALSIGAYLVVMIFRIVYLWALIVLSPLAFMLHAVPKGEDYAHEWWHEFNKQVIVAPIMVFFLWLAFATLGTGQIITEIQSGENVIQINSSGEEQQTVSILEISTWENFASFLLGIGFLWVGIKKTEETGAAGSHLVGGAIDWTKNVATIATGYAAGRWLVGGAVSKVHDGIIHNTPLIGAHAWERRKEAVSGLYNAAKSRIGQARDGVVQEWERKREEKKERGESTIVDTLKLLTAGKLLQSGKRADALAENYTKIAELADEEHEAKISTSRTTSGNMKDTARVRAELAVEAKQAKGPQKSAERTLKLMKEGNKSVEDSLKALASAKAKGHDLEELVETKKQKAIAEKIDKLEHGDHHDHDVEKFHEVRGELGKLKAITEKLEHAVSEEHHLHEEQAVERLSKPITSEERAAVAALTDPIEKAAAEKDLKEREEYQKYLTRSTELEKRLENVKAANESEQKVLAGQILGRLSSVDEEFKRREGVIARGTARAKAIEDRKNAEKEIMLLGEIRNLLQTDGLTATMKAQAELETVKAQLDPLQIDAMARQRAQQYETQGDHLRAEAIQRKAAAEIQKKTNELFADLKYADRLVLEQYLIDQIQREERKGPGEIDEEKLSKLRRQKTALTISNLSSDGDTIRDTSLRSMAQLGITKLNGDNRLKFALRQLTGSSSDDIDTLKTVFREMHKDPTTGGVDERLLQLTLQQYEDATKAAALKGYEHLLGNIDNVFDVSAGRVIRSFKNTSDNRPSSYFATRAQADSIAGYADLEVTVGADGSINQVIDGFSDRGINSVGEFLRSKDSRAMATEKMKPVHESMNSITIRDSDHASSFISFLKKAQEVMKPDGFLATKTAWNIFYQRLQAAASDDQKKDIEALFAASTTKSSKKT